MNFTWDIILNAEKNGIPEKKLFFRQAKSCSPCYEQSFPCLNQSKVEDKTVEINSLFRFAPIFQEILRKDQEDFPEFREYLLDIIIHFLSNMDLRHGLSKREFYIRKLSNEILSGGFGENAAECYQSIPADFRNRLATLVLTQFQTGSSLLLFRKSVRILFPEALFYQLKAEARQTLLYIGRPRTQQRENALKFAVEMFLPVNCRIRVFWGFHFGVVGVGETMRVDEIAIY